MSLHIAIIPLHYMCNGVITVMVHYTTWAALAGLITLQLHYHYTLHITRPHYTRRNADTLGAS